MRTSGFTLIEVLMASALLAIGGGIIWQTWLLSSESSELINDQTSNTGEMMQLFDQLGFELRGASLASLSALPAAQLTFRRVEDVGGNGIAIDAKGVAKLGEPVTIQRDLEDLNHDGLRGEQLVLLSSGGVRVLANHLVPATADAEDPGLWFGRTGEAVSISIALTGTTRRGHASNLFFTQTFRPRNP